MRITKKFTGSQCLGKKVYRGTDNKKVNEEDIEKTRVEIDELEERFKEKLERSRRVTRNLNPVPDPLLMQNGGILFSSTHPKRVSKNPFPPPGSRMQAITSLHHGLMGLGRLPWLCSLIYTQETYL